MRLLWLAAMAWLAPAQEILELPPPPADHRIVYGPAPQQFADLRLPTGKGPHPVMVVLHGGYWRAKYDLAYAGHMSAALTKRGFATWNIEYRRVGQPGGGYPGTLDDVAAAVAHLKEVAKLHAVDLSRVYAIGHSAGGHLALWLAAEGKVKGALALGSVFDLEEGWRRKMGNDAVQDFMGCALPDCPEKYHHASPAARLPLRVPIIVIHGVNDKIVPIDVAEAFERSAKKADDRVGFLRVESGDHFNLVDPRTPEWKTVEDAAAGWLR